MVYYLQAGTKVYKKGIILVILLLKLKLFLMSLNDLLTQEIISQFWEFAKGFSYLIFLRQTLLKLL